MKQFINYCCEIFLNFTLSKMGAPRAKLRNGQNFRASRFHQKSSARALHDARAHQGARSRPYANPQNVTPFRCILHLERKTKFHPGLTTYAWSRGNLGTTRKQKPFAVLQNSLPHSPSREIINGKYSEPIVK